MNGSPPSFPPAQVTRGAQLADMGDCLVCHTAVDGKPYAGGRPPADAVRDTLRDQHYARGGDRHRALVAGSVHPCHARRRRCATVAISTRRSPMTIFRAHGRRSRALYAFMMTREPVSGAAPRNDLLLSAGRSSLLAGWKLLSFDHDAPPARRGAKRGMESGRLSRRRAGPLRGLSHAAQFSGRRRSAAITRAARPKAGTHPRSIHRRARPCRGRSMPCSSISSVA